MTNVTHALRKLPYLAAASDGHLRRLAGACAWRTVDKGGQLFREGEDAKGVFLILDGRVKLVRLSRTGREQVLHVEDPGASLGEVPVIDDEGYLATAVALTRVRALFVPRRGLLHLCEDQPAVALAIAAAIARRLRSFSALIGALSLQTATARLAGVLVREHQRTGDRLVDVGPRDEVAARLGTVREIVSRSLTHLVKAGAITRVGRRVRIVNVRKLQAIAEP